MKCDIARSLLQRASPPFPLILPDVEPNLFARNLDLGQAGVEIEAAAAPRLNEVQVGIEQKARAGCAVIMMPNPQICVSLNSIKSCFTNRTCHDIFEIVRRILKMRTEGERE